MSWVVEFVGGDSLIWSSEMTSNSVSLVFKMLQPTTQFTSNIESSDTGAKSGLPYQRVVFNINFQKFYLRDEVTDSQDRELYYNLVNLSVNKYLWIKSIGSNSERFTALQASETTALHAGATALSVTNLTGNGTIVTLESAGHGLTSGKWINTKDVQSASITVPNGSYQATYIDADNVSIILAETATIEVATGTIAEVGKGKSNYILPIQIVTPEFGQLEFMENLAADNFALTVESKGLYLPTIFS